MDWVGVDGPGVLWGRTHGWQHWGSSPSTVNRLLGSLATEPKRVQILNHPILVHDKNQSAFTTRGLTRQMQLFTFTFTHCNHFLINKQLMSSWYLVINHGFMIFKWYFHTGRCRLIRRMLFRGMSQPEEKRHKIAHQRIDKGGLRHPMKLHL